MASDEFSDLAAFAIVARERSFTKAASILGMSQPRLSVRIRSLEKRIGLRLLARTTRSVAPTEAGDRVLRSIMPRFAEIKAELAALSELREKPAGTVRITAGERPAISILQPALKRFLPDHPDVRVEIIVDQGLTDIVAGGYDAGVRMGEQVAKDMIAVPIGPKIRMAVVASPDYFERYPIPKTPQDLTGQKCINMRLPTRGGIFPWGLKKNGREIKVRGEGQLVFNSLSMRLNSALDGLGIAYIPEDQVISHIDAGRLVRVLEDWCPYFPGYHLYYPSRHHFSPVLALLVDVLRYKGS